MAEIFPHTCSQTNFPMATSVSIQEYVNLFVYQPNVDTPIEIMNVPVIAPKAVIVEQPQGNFRFRYGTEQGNHGSILGVKNGPNGGKKSKKSFPKVQIQDYCTQDCPVVKLRVSLATTNDLGTAKLHVHELQNQAYDLPNGVFIQEIDYREPFELNGLHIKHVGCKEANTAELLLGRKIGNRKGVSEQEMKRLRAESTKEAKEFRKFMNKVSLKIEFFDLSDTLLCQTFSDIINNTKNNSGLKITAMAKRSGSPKGDELMIILCEKVDKKDIKIRFYEEEGNWEAFGSFTEIGVWHQYAIEFHTPAYHTLELDEPVTVKVQLFQPSNKSSSEPIDFIYEPNKNDDYVKRKRQRTEAPCSDTNAMNQYQLNQPGTSTAGFSNFGANFSNAPNAGLNVNQTMQVALGAGFNDGQLQQSNISDELAQFLGTNSLQLNIDAATQYTQMETATNEPQTAEIVDYIIDTWEQEVSGLMTSQTDPLLSQASVQPESPEQQIAANKLYLMEGLDDIVSDSPTVEPDSKAVQPPRKLIPRSSVSEKEDPPLAEKTKDVKPTVCQKTVSGYRMVYNLAVKTAEQLQIYAKTSDVSYLLGPMSHLIAIQDENGDNAIHNAVIHADEDSTALFNLVKAVSTTSSTQETSLNMFNNVVQTPLHIAVHVDSPKMVQALLEHGANPNLLDRHGNTALHLASRHGKEELVKIFLNKDVYKEQLKDHYPNLDLLNYDGYTPLHLAIQAKSLACVRLLCEAGADINVEDGTSGRSAIHSAVEYKNEEILKELLNQKYADVNTQTFGGYTPLHFACSAGNTKMVRLLLDADADPMLESIETKSEESSEEDDAPAKVDDANEESDNHGYNSFDLATNNTEILKLLQGVTEKKQSIASVDTILHTRSVSLKHESVTDLETSRPVYDDSGLIDDFEDDSGFHYKPDESPQGLQKETEKPGFGDSGLGFQTSELDRMNDDVKKRLASLLDPTGPNDWKNLAKQLDLDFLSSSLGSAQSPTIALLSYVPTIKSLRDGLVAIGSHEATKIIDTYSTEGYDQKEYDVESSVQKMKNLALS